MKKIIIIIISIVILSVGYWLISPFFIDVRVSEALPNEVMSREATPNSKPSDMLVMSGTFIGFDKIHNGTGIVSIYQFADASVGGQGYKKSFLRFEEGFQVNNGPDLYVGFGKDGQYVKGSEISKLKGNIGSQNYEIPASIDLSQYDSVWVWCKAFSTPFIKADLKKVSQVTNSQGTNNSGENNSAKVAYTNASADLIQVELPFPGAVVGKDFSVIGKARGNWFFEASFPIEVLDKNGKILARGIAQPRDGDTWMTTEFVNFKADIQIPQTYIGPVTLILRKDNPSGLVEHDASIAFPITVEY